MNGHIVHTYVFMSCDLWKRLEGTELVYKLVISASEILVESKEKLIGNFQTLKNWQRNLDWTGGLEPESSGLKSAGNSQQLVVCI